MSSRKKEQKYPYRRKVISMTASNNTVNTQNQTICTSEMIIYPTSDNEESEQRIKNNYGTSRPHLVDLKGNKELNQGFESILHISKQVVDGVEETGDNSLCQNAQSLEQNLGIPMDIKQDNCTFKDKSIIDSLAKRNTKQMSKGQQEIVQNLIQQSENIDSLVDHQNQPVTKNDKNELHVCECKTCFLSEEHLALHKRMYCMLNDTPVSQYSDHQYCEPTILPKNFPDVFPCQICEKKNKIVFFKNTDLLLSHMQSEHASKSLLHESKIPCTRKTRSYLKKKLEKTRNSEKQLSTEESNNNILGNQLKVIHLDEDKSYLKNKSIEEGSDKIFGNQLTIFHLNEDKSLSKCTCKWNKSSTFEEICDMLKKQSNFKHISIPIGNNFNQEILEELIKKDRKGFENIPNYSYTFSNNLVPQEKRRRSLNSERLNFEKMSELLKRQKHMDVGDCEKMCDLCGCMFNKASTFRKHLQCHKEGKEILSQKRAHGYWINNRNVKRYFRKCDHCHLLFKSSGILKNHIRSKHSGEMIQCPQCPKQFKVQNGLDYHMEIKHTIEKPYICDVCSATFGQKKWLTRHRQIIHNIDVPTWRKTRRHLCSYCPASFFHPSKLRDHIRSHTGEKPYICQACGKGYARSDYLKEHMRRYHTPGGRRKPDPIICKVCGQSCSTTGLFKDHMRIHTGEKPFKCDICGEAFRMNRMMKKHRETHGSDCHHKVEFNMRMQEAAVL